MVENNINNIEINNKEKKQSRIKQIFRAMFSSDEDVSKDVQSEVDKLNADSETNIKKLESKILSDKKKSRKALTEELKISDLKSPRTEPISKKENKEHKKEEQDELVK